MMQFSWFMFWLGYQMGREFANACNYGGGDGRFS